ncbi:sulfotransferase [Mycobacterium sp.]|uniref:sulfotransferase family protein n=1 Tax=Mycobacterium sp. TaxID=1785 RepID=UPI0025EFB858|nr:sulfotransferase [Mycobacterium sp.]
MTNTAPPPVHLDDLDAPRFSPEIDQLHQLMAGMAAECPLDSATLHAKAAVETGLTDFGPDDYRERLEVYLAALGEIGGLHGAGIVNFHAQVLQSLKNRLLLNDLLARHPEIHQIELLPPVVIAGLPRTGTTHLHNLLAAGPTFRSLPYWESVEPFPLPAERGIEPDPRRGRMDAAVDFMNAAMPHFPLMHEMTTEHAHEEIQLLANDFSTMLFETLAHVPRWRDYYLGHDQTSSYEHLKLQLKALQFLRGGRRWLLKSPQHLEQLPVLDAVFPGVVVVFTHRDPVPVVLSMLAMLAYTARMHRSPVPVHDIAESWSQRLALMLRALIRDRDLIPPERSIDVRFDDFMADEIGTVERIYHLAGEPLTDPARGAMVGYLESHQRGRMGSIATSAEMFGLDEHELPIRYTRYRERFSV